LEQENATSLDSLSTDFPDVLLASNQIIDKNRSISFSSGSSEFSTPDAIRNQVRGVFTRMGFIGIEETRANPLPGESISDRIHRWHRHQSFLVEPSAK
jgi:hypothetical protein